MDTFIACQFDKRCGDIFLEIYVYVLAYIGSDDSFSEFYYFMYRN